MHADKIKSAHVPLKGLLHLFQEDLSKLMKEKSERALQVVGDDIILSPRLLTPPPHLQGRGDQGGACGRARIPETTGERVFENNSFSRASWRIWRTTRISLGQARAGADLAHAGLSELITPEAGHTKGDLIVHRLQFICSVVAAYGLLVGSATAQSRGRGHYRRRRYWHRHNRRRGQRRQPGFSIQLS